MRTALITGACGGIGAAAVDAFRSEGWRVIGVDRSAPPTGLSLDEFISADLSSDQGVDEVVAALPRLTRLDALVNNAAVQVNRPLTQTTDNDWEAVINTNVRAAFQLIRDLHPALAASRGGIVNVSSVHAVATSPNVAAYAISKGALVALTRSAALELAVDGIRCNAILPGAVRTPMLLDGLARRTHPDGPEGNLRELTNRTPLGFVAEPRHIAPTIVHLADADKSPYTTGQAIVLDGGATIRLSTE